MKELIVGILKKLFSKSTLGTLLYKILNATGSVVVREILDQENQDKAYEFVKELNARTDLTVLEKAKEFNAKFAAWGHSMDKEISESVINLLRELAVNAIKAELGK